MGGQDGSRGYLYQSIISVLSACMTNDWNYISVEYKTESDKVDIAFSKEQTITKVIQVKSSINLFKKATIKQWMKEIKSDVISEEYEIILIGNCGQDTNVFIKDIANYNRDEIGTKKITDFEDITNIIKDKNFKIKLIPFDQDHLMSIVRDNVNRWIFTKGYAVDPISLEQLVLALVSLTTFWGTEGIQVKKDTYENKIFDWLKNSAGNKFKKIVSISELKVSSYSEDRNIFTEPKLLKAKSLQSYQRLRSSLINKGKILIDEISKIDLEPYIEVIVKCDNATNELNNNKEENELVIGGKIEGNNLTKFSNALIGFYVKAELGDKEKEKIISEIKKYWDIDITKEFFYVGKLKKSNAFTGVTGKISYEGEEIEKRKHKYLELLEIFVYKLNCIDTFLDMMKKVYILPLCIQNIGATVDNNISVSVSVRGKYFHLLNLKNDLERDELEILNTISDYLVEESIIKEIFSARENKDISVEPTKTINVPPISMPFDPFGRRSVHDLESLIYDIEDFQVEENDSGYTTYNISNLRPGEAKWLSPFPLLICDIKEIGIEYTILSEASETKCTGEILVSE